MDLDPGRNLGECPDWVRGQEALRKYVEKISQGEASELVKRAYEFVEQSRMPKELQRDFFKLLRDYCNHGSSSTADSRDEFYRQLRLRLEV